MRKNILFIILSIIIAVSFFAIAATCSFCGKQINPVNDRTKIDVEEDADETVPEDTGKETSQDTVTNQSNNDEGKTPTISLEISEGPVYSESDDICYYRVKATVTGNPAPLITWSKDYSNNSFGDFIAQVNLTRDNPNYTLNATATNSEGTATDSISLSWGCGGEGDEEETVEEVADEEEVAEESGIETFGEGGGEPTVTTLNVDKYNSGYIVEDGSGESRGNILFGDNTENEQIRGFLSFDIRSLSDLPIDIVELRISNITKSGNPSGQGDLYIYSKNFGTLNSGDFELGGSYALTLFFPTPSLTSINTSENILKNRLEAYKNNGYDALQFVFLLNLGSNNNGNNDYFVINPDNVKLYVTQ